MEHSCQQCHLLLCTGKRHPDLHTISYLHQSELAKCDICSTYYLHERNHWEFLPTLPNTPNSNNTHSNI
ncbi:MAG: hypothetical protein GYB41_01875 [Oceanospirillales bacterium]|uniref:Uncharacterized protein n=1 Tax=Marinobacterium halophilum TaxID=267374 RepID=A0A2P8F0I2_9GAMM|nr:hypothetical protein [Oceanospirillales bacterium]PSL15230.1 hypothetical protein CLV44_105124 [Marinobacterium halophilum]